MQTPCNGCTLCCHGDAIRLLPGDDPTAYQTVPHDHDARFLMLAHKPNGDCIYLDEHGCTIHATKPQMCREMDCRNVAKNISYTQARKLDRKGILKLPVWRKGRQLMIATTKKTVK
jgi:Fe-S-cluster containining protein